MNTNASSETIRNLALRNMNRRPGQSRYTGLIETPESPRIRSLTNEEVEHITSLIQSSATGLEYTTQLRNELDRLERNRVSALNLDSLRHILRDAESRNNIDTFFESYTVPALDLSILIENSGWNDLQENLLSSQQPSSLISQEEPPSILTNAREVITGTSNVATGSSSYMPNVAIRSIDAAYEISRNRPLDERPILTPQQARERSYNTNVSNIATRSANNITSNWIRDEFNFEEFRRETREKLTNCKRHKESNLQKLSYETLLKQLYGLPVELPSFLILNTLRVNFIPFEEAAQMLNQHKVNNYIIEPLLQPFACSPIGEQINRILTIFGTNGMTYLVKARVENNMIFPPV